MRGSQPVASSCLALALTLASPAVAAAHAPAPQDPAAEEVASLFERGRYDLAYRESQYIESPALRAAWRFHVLYNAGNLPAALDAAREGLRDAPGSLDLHQNAAHCAVTLGLGELATRLVEAWGKTIEEAELAEPDRARWEEAQRRVASQAREVRERELAAESADRRSRWVSLAGFATVGAALLVLSLASRRERIDGAPGPAH